MARYAYILDKSDYTDEGESYRIEFTPGEKVLEIRVFSPVFEDYGNNANPMWLGANIDEVKLLRDFLNEYLEKKGEDDGKIK